MLVPSVVIPTGRLNLAAGPVPSVDPDRANCGLPAIVVTTRLAITIFLIVLLPLSDTYRFVPSVVIPSGRLNLAAGPVPSVDPEEAGSDIGLPAIVVTTRLVITIFLIVLLVLSDT